MSRDDVALMMMDGDRRAPRRPLSACLPPELYYRSALRLLCASRRLFRAGLIGGRGMILALRWSNRLSLAGMDSWRRRTARLGCDGGRARRRTVERTTGAATS